MTRKSAAFLFALLGVLVALLPVLGTPRVSDDVINYSFRWLSAGDFARATLDEIQYWAMSSGRVYVFSTVLKNMVFQLFGTALAYKIYMLLVSLVCAATFFMYVRMVSESRLTPVLVLVLLPIFIQLRDFHDPIVAFNGLFQVCSILVFACLMLHLRYLETGRAGWLGACVAAFFFNLFFYELAAITLFLVAIQDWLADSAAGRRYRTSKCLLGTFVVYLVMMVSARLVGSYLLNWAPSQYGFNFSPAAVAMTLAKQLVAVIPFSFVLFKPNDGAWGVRALPELTPWLGSWQFALAVPLFAAIAWFSLRSLARPSGAVEQQAQDAPRNVKIMALVSVMLIGIPAILIGLVSRYQGAFGFGNGYSVVFLQIFGAALGVALLLSLALRSPRRRKAVVIALSATCAVLSAGNLVNNLAVAEKLSEAWGPQYTWAAALNAPDMKEVCAKAPVLVMDPAPWTEYRILRHAGHLTVSIQDVDKHRQQASGATADICVARGVRVLGRSGVAFVRARIAPGAPLVSTSGLHLVLPLDKGETRVAVQLGGRCLEVPRRLSLVSDWQFGGARYGLFVLDGPESGVVWNPTGFALPCEQGPS